MGLRLQFQALGDFKFGGFNFKPLRASSLKGDLLGTKCFNLKPWRTFTLEGRLLGSKCFDFKPWSVGRMSTWYQRLWFQAFDKFLFLPYIYLPRQGNASISSLRRCQKCCKHFLSKERLQFKAFGYFKFLMEFTWAKNGFNFKPYKM